MNGNIPAFACQALAIAGSAADKIILCIAVLLLSVATTVLIAICVKRKSRDMAKARNKAIDENGEDSEE